MMTTRNLLVRAVEGAENGGGSSVTPAETPAEHNAAESAAVEGETAEAEGSANDAEQSEDPDGRGSKRAVLADLARERAKRHELEAELSRERENSARNADANEKVNTLAAQVEELIAERRDLQIKTVLSESGLPAEMATRLRGDTLEDLKADAESLAKVFNTSAGSDPTQGRGGSPRPQNMTDALSAYYS